MQTRKISDYIWPCLLALLLCFSVATIAGWVTQGNISTWFVHLQKPSFNPPSWLFGPVWSILYFLIGISGGIIWVHRHKLRGAFYCYAVQLALNLAWSFIFFGLHQLGWALIDISFLIIFVLLTCALCYKKNRLVSWLLLPYLAWICFAFTLNFSLWLLN
jgi:tryptophan-rich sensory protein